MNTLLQNTKPTETTPAHPPSFVDMRAFARDPLLGRSVGALPGDDAFLSSRRMLDWAPGPVSAGVIELAAGQGAVAALPADECLLVHEGQLTLTQADSELTLRPGQAAAIPQGTAFAWSATASVSLIVTRYHNSQPGGGRIVAIQEAPALQPSGSPPLDLLTTPVPDCRNFTDYTSADGAFVCGTWDSTPYARRALFYRHYELMHLLEGSVRFLDATGRSRTFSQGDIFLVEQGASCTWDSREHVTKLYVIYRPQ